MQAGNQKPNLLPRREVLRLVPAYALAFMLAGEMLMIASCARAGTALSVSTTKRIKASPNFKNGRFVNPTPSRQPKIFEMLRKWIAEKAQTTPKEPVPIEKRQRQDFQTPPASGLRITWLGHSSSLVEIDDKRLLLDPIWSERSSPVSFMGPKRFFAPPLALDELPPIDAVLISHDHYDHLDEATVRHLAKRKTPFIVPLGVGAHLESWDLPPGQIIELDWWDSFQLADLTITATPARHFSGRSLIMADRNKTLWAGFAICGPKHRLYYSGDTAMFDGLAEIGRRLGPFDASLIEAGAYDRLWADFHMGPEQALQALELVQGGLMIPMHWGTFELAMHSWTEPAERLMAAARRVGLSLAIPLPGQQVEPATPPILARWWPELPWQSAEEHPVVSSGLSQSMTPKVKAISQLDASSGW